MNWPDKDSTDFVRWAASRDLQVVFRGLSRGPAQHRELLAKVLGEYQTEESVKALFALLDDSSKKARRAAIVSLSRMPKAMLSDGVAESLASPRKHRREAAQELLNP